ncbi:undecaprenyl diphosphate synthase family protein [Haloquadratum walsbyi]|uniref:Tritrans,polycis-undecaprenyl-diphosphate synthase (Geranylgeranyl-diphosphate specific) n=1 Tax=Haloquadratum walsbyi (strain DSM 16790 / HBSQ001) TaxID=362976 RepID=Q18F33_HALWD|nr:undecaprenyl diphosphate synthase family protein [Haloquadratum walsbyi]CAJ53428.1 tritrans,polycis-undecaprenyl-diphosphate synthase (geranylgeranyl-diphosphate specific) [Haloquadratum walsbyi DSM 16790]
MGIYDWYLVLRHRFHDAKPPAHVAVVITERDLLEQGAYQTLSQFLNWAFEYGATRVTISVSVLDEAVVPTLAREFRDLTTPRSIVVRQPSNTEPADAPIQVNIGLGGKREFAAAVRQIAEAVDEGSIDPDTVDADTIEDRLVFDDEPDLVIKTGAERLSDFLIWQSVYSELYFTDVNWRDFRRRDYVRAVIDYQNRQRRFGQ